MPQSQEPGLGVGVSSTASASVAQNVQNADVANSRADPAWKYCTLPNKNMKHQVKCNFCGKICASGITRAKYHLAKVPKSNVAACEKVPTDVKEEMCELLTKKIGIKEKKEKDRQMARAEEGEASSEEEDHNSIVVMNPSRVGSASSSKGGPMERFCKRTPEEAIIANKESSLSKKVQTKLSTQKREERRERACEYICQFVRARSLTTFLYSHTRVLALMRKFLGMDLVRAGITRFATAYLNLKSMLDNKKELGKLFRSNELNEMGYLKKDKGKNASKIVRSDTFWKNVDCAVNFFEPLANVLRRIDSDVPAMGFLYGCLLEAKNDIAKRFDNDEHRFKTVWEIIDKRWDNKLKTPLHLAGYYLNPYYYYPNKLEIELDGTFREGLVSCITKMVQEVEIQDKIIDELNMYQDGMGSFGKEIATRQRRNGNFNPAKWWLNHGNSSPNLRKLAIKILGLTCSSSGCERNWSDFEQVDSKRRSRLLHDRMRDLVFVKFNSRLKQQKENKSRDPIEKQVSDILEDSGNVWITRVASIEQEQPQDTEVVEAANAQGRSARTTTEPGKRKREVQPRRRKRTRKLIDINECNDDEPELASSSDSEEEDAHVDMDQQSSSSHSSDSDNSVFDE